MHNVTSIISSTAVAGLQVALSWRLLPLGSPMDHGDHGGAS